MGDWCPGLRGLGTASPDHLAGLPALPMGQLPWGRSGQDMPLPGLWTKQRRGGELVRGGEGRLKVSVASGLGGQCRALPVWHLPASGSPLAPEEFGSRARHGFASCTPGWPPGRERGRLRGRGHTREQVTPCLHSGVPGCRAPDGVKGPRWAQLLGSS